MRVVTLVTLLFAAGCACHSDWDCPLDERCSNGRCIAAGGPDVTPPSVALSGPLPGAAVSGAIALTANASDDVAVASVDFTVDGAVIATARGEPYTATWQSGTVGNGPHTLAAVAVDTSGNSAGSGPVQVAVGNYPGAALSVHTTLGLADAATTDLQNQGHFLSVKHQYALSYDGARRVPNWVSWELNKSWLGSIPRQNDFRPDDTFPAGFPQAQLSDYLNSGWDRGHLCPSEDRTATLADNQDTFYLTNMTPQADNVNGGPWAQLEAYQRGLANAGKELFVVAGGIYPQTVQTIGADHVAIPSSLFKLAVVLDAPGQTAADVTSATRVIAVIMPNDTTVSRTADWRTFRVQPSAIEAQTGFRLMSDVAEPVRTQLEGRVDSAP